MVEVEASTVEEVLVLKTGKTVKMVAAVALPMFPLILVLACLVGQCVFQTEADHWVFAVGEDVIQS